MDFVPWPHWFSLWPQFGLTNDGLLAGLLAGKMLWQKFGIVMLWQVPREALKFAGMSINFLSGKFGYSICPIFSKGHAEIFREF